MRRFRSLITAVPPIILALATVALTKVLSPRIGPSTELPVSPVNPQPTRARRVRSLHAVPLVAVLAIGATAFAVNAETPSEGAQAAAGARTFHATRAVTTTTIDAATERAAIAETNKQAAIIELAEAQRRAAIVQARQHQADLEKVAAIQRLAAAQEANRAAAAVQQPAPVSSGVQGACGGNLPPCCVMMRESRGNPTAVNASSGASGKWQFMANTWANYGGYPTAASAPEAVQDQRAAQVWAGGAGAGHWGGGC